MNEGGRNSICSWFVNVPDEKSGKVDQEKKYDSIWIKTSRHAAKSTQIARLSGSTQTELLNIHERNWRNCLEVKYDLEY